MKNILRNNLNKFSSLSKISNFESYLQQNQKFSKCNNIPEELIFSRTFERNKLNNGIDITTLKSKSNKAVISVFVKCGSVHEKDANSGSAHFLEHMHFKGTTKRTRQQLEIEIEDQGGFFNAFTTREYTSYILEMPKEKLNWGVELLSDLLTNSLYLDSSIQSEKSTINTELLECLRDPCPSLMEFAHENSYRNDSIGKPILGRRQNIDSVTRQMVVDYHNNNYVGQNFMFITAGNIEHDQVTEQIDRRFSKLPMKREINDQELLDNMNKIPQFIPGSMFIESPPSNTKFGLYWEACNWYHKDYLPFMIFQRVLGDYEKQFDFQSEDEEKHSLIDQLKRNLYIEKVDTAFLPYLKTGIFGCYIETKPDDVIKAYDFFMNFMQQYIDKISERELQTAKSQIIPELLKIENGVDFTQDIGQNLVHLDRIMTKSEFIQRVYDLDLNDIKGIMQNWIVNKPFSLTIWGQKDSAEKLLKHHGSTDDNRLIKKIYYLFNQNPPKKQMEIYRQEKLHFDGQQIQSIECSKKTGSDLIAVQSLRQICFYNSKGQRLDEIYESENDISVFQWHPRLSDIAIGNSVGEIEIYNPLRKEVIQTEAIHDSKIIFISFSKKGDLMISQDKYLKVVFWINLNPIKIDQKYARINRMIFVNYILEDQDSSDSKIQLAFLGDKSGKIEYFEEKKLQIKELCQLNGSIQEIFYLESTSTVIVLTTQGYLIQFRISTNEDINLEKKVKISTGTGNFQGLWIPNNSFVLNTGESSLKFWDIKNDINYSLNMFDFISQNNQTRQLEIKDFAYNQNEKNLFVALSSGEILTFYNKNCQIMCNKEEWQKIGVYKTEDFLAQQLTLDKKGNLYVCGKQELVLFKRNQCKIQTNEKFRIYQRELDQLQINEIGTEQFLFENNQTIMDYIINNDKLIYIDEEYRIHKIYIKQLKQNKKFSNFDNHSIQIENHLKKIYLMNETFLGIKDSKNLYFFNYQNEMLLEFKNQSSQQYFIDIIVGQDKNTIGIIDNQYKMKIFSTNPEILILHECINLKQIVGNNKKVNQISISKDAKRIFLLVNNKQIHIKDIQKNTKVEYINQQNIKSMKLDILDDRYFYIMYQEQNQLKTDIMLYGENQIKKFDSIITQKDQQLLNCVFPLIQYVGYDANNEICFNNQRIKIFENLNDNYKVNKFARDFTYNIVFEELKQALRNLKDFQLDFQQSEFWNKLLDVALKNENKQIVDFCLEKNQDFLNYIIMNDEYKQQNLGEISRNLGKLDFALDKFQKDKKHFQVCEILFIQENYKQLIEYIKSNKKCLLNFYYYKIALKYFQIQKYKKFFEFWNKSGSQEINLFKLFKEAQNLEILESYNQTINNYKINRLLFKYYFEQGNYVKAKSFIEINKENQEQLGLFYLNQKNQAVNSLVKQDQIILPIKLQEQVTSDDSILTLIELYLKRNKFCKVIQIIKKNQKYFQQNEDIYDKILDFLYNKAINNVGSSVCKVGKFFEECNYNEKAVKIYIQSQNYRRAYVLAKKNNLNQELIEIQEKYEALKQQPSQDHNNKFYQLVQNQEFDKAINILQNQPIFISDEQYQLIKNSNQKNKSELQKQIGINWRQEGQYDKALKVFIDLRNNIEAVKTIISKKDNQKLIQFTNFCRENKIYEMTANYLQSCNFQFNDSIYKAIITFYKKCKNFKSYENFLKYFLKQQFDEGLYDNCLKILQDIESNKNFNITKEQIEKERQMVNIYKNIEEDQQDNWITKIVYVIKRIIQNQNKEMTNEILQKLQQKKIKFKDKLSLQQQQYLNDINPQNDIEENYDEIKEDFF